MMTSQGLLMSPLSPAAYGMAGGGGGAGAGGQMGASGMGAMGSLGGDYGAALLSAYASSAGQPQLQAVYEQALLQAGYGAGLGAGGGLASLYPAASAYNPAAAAAAAAAQVHICPHSPLSPTLSCPPFPRPRPCHPGRTECSEAAAVASRHPIPLHVIILLQVKLPSPPLLLHPSRRSQRRPPSPSAPLPLLRF